MPVRSRSRVPVRKSASYKSGIVLFVMLVVMYFLVRGVNESGLPAGLSSLINADFENFKNLEQFGDEKAEEVQKMLGGFWTFAEGDIETSPVSKREYLEINQNGIIWYVTEWFLNMPAGGRYRIKHVAYGYHKPYSYSPDNESYYSEVRVIRQAYIVDSDTCHGASQQDEIWQMALTQDGGTINVNRREYVKYTGELTAFFPEDTDLGIVDRFDIPGCAAAASMPHYSKRLVARYLNASPFFARVQASEELIRDYYKPIVFDELSRRFDPRAVPDDMTLKLTLSPEGVVTDVRYRSAKLVTKRFDDLAVPDIRTWAFPPVGDTNDPQTLDLTVRVK